MSSIESLSFFRTELILLAGAFIVLFSDLFFRNKKMIGLVALAALAVSSLFLNAPDEPLPLFQGLFMLDGLTVFFRITALGTVALVILLSLFSPKLPEKYLGEYYSLFLFTAFGLTLMAAAANLAVIFLAVEFVSLISYLLVGFLKRDNASKEASLKYLLFGSFASAIMLYGMSLIYGISGSLDLDVIRLRLPGTDTALLMTALFMVFAGIGFKVSMAPFHLWAPDVYQGAPTPVTAFLTVAPKALGFAVFIRFLASAFLPFFESWTTMIVALAILTMTLGNVIAITQDNVKRLLAYSSIAQAGYILMGIAVFSDTGLQAILFYVAAYALTNLGAFAIVLAIAESEKSEDLQAYSGLAKRSPLLAASLTVFFLSLAGIPPFAGFVAKFLVFASAVKAGYMVLAVAAVINSVVAAFYYFKVVRQMYLTPALVSGPVVQPLYFRIALSVTLAGTVLAGVFPSPLLSFVMKAVTQS